MPFASLSMRVQVQFDRTPEMERRVRDALEPSARETALEYLRIAAERVRNQDVPGRPLAEITIKSKKKKLEARGQDTSRADDKWYLFGIATEEPSVMTQRRDENHASAFIMPPTGTDEELNRPYKLYRILERGGVIDGRTIPPRPLWSDILQKNNQQLIKAFLEEMKRRIA